MLRRQRQIHAQMQELFDAALFALGFWLAHWLRASWQVDNPLLGRPVIEPFSRYAWLLLVILPITPMLLQAQGFYNRPLLPSRRQTLWQLSWATLWITMVLIFASFLVRQQPARAVIMLFAPISFLLVLLKEEIVRSWILSSAGQSQLRRRLVIVGTPEDRLSLHRKLARLANVSVDVCAELDLNEQSLEDLITAVHDHSANGVVMTTRHSLFGQVERVIEVCELEGVEVWLLADFFKTRISRTELDDFYGLPMMVFRSVPVASWQGVAKQLLDFAGAGFLLALSSPFLLAAGACIRLSSPGPVLFRQQRSGLNGKPFTMYKFRTMVNNAEQQRHELERLNEMSGPVFKVTNDPRVTPIGRFLRKYSIDEFPQLLNVLRGDMSLVGPRPLPVDEVKRFDDLAHRRRLSVKPGLTCLWQVSGRNNVSDFKEWVRLDLEYIDNWSLWLDFKILLRTVPIVLLGTGAK